MSSITSATNAAPMYLDQNDMSNIEVEDGNTATIVIKEGATADITVEGGSAADIYVLDGSAVSQITVREGATANIHFLEDVEFDSAALNQVADLDESTYAQTTLTPEALAESANLTSVQGQALVALFDADEDGELNQAEIETMKETITGALAANELGQEGSINLETLATYMGDSEESVDLASDEPAALVSEEEPAGLSNEKLADMAIKKHEGTGINRDPYNNDSRIGIVEIANASGITGEASEFLRSLGNADGFMDKNELVSALAQGFITVDPETGKISLTNLTGTAKAEAANPSEASVPTQPTQGAAVIKGDKVEANQGAAVIKGDKVEANQGAAVIKGDKDTAGVNPSLDGLLSNFEKYDLTGSNFLEKNELQAIVNGKGPDAQAAEILLNNFNAVVFGSGDDRAWAGISAVDITALKTAANSNPALPLDKLIWDAAIKLALDRGDISMDTPVEQQKKWISDRIESIQDTVGFQDDRVSRSLDGLIANFAKYDLNNNNFLEKTDLQAIVNGKGPDAQAAEILLNNFNGAIFSHLQYDTDKAWVGISAVDLAALQAAASSKPALSLEQLIWDVAIKVALDVNFIPKDTPVDQRKGLLHDNVEYKQTGGLGIQDDEVIHLYYGSV